jgi:hypothetical protein
MINPMIGLQAAWRSAGLTENCPVLSQGQAGPLPGPTLLAVSVSPGGPQCLEITLDPITLTAAANAGEGVAHWLRLADASLKPLAARPALLKLARGDSYVAVISGAGELDLGQRMAAARFIHLRDYFNAEKMAAALLAELAEPRLGVLVVECR